MVEPIEEGDKVKAEISHVLLKAHIKQLKKEGKWPKQFDDEEEEEECKTVIDDNLDDKHDEDEYSDDSSLNLEENPNHAIYDLDEERSEHSGTSSSDEDERCSEDRSLGDKKANA